MAKALAYSSKASISRDEPYLTVEIDLPVDESVSAQYLFFNEYVEYSED